ncbi:hypothetical protein CPLU01_06861 [Colletotrichum plurivorum]|uniref:Cyanovirin-N domain-containing protein n=1 Tax=Colletotrichum plurivorum TaxID=2175906 RepID=A0A8H6NFB6_9PEZI|nr:hypothetical protein CPLU01_06861 [Colletotrichum plurivorum]
MHLGKTLAVSFYLVSGAVSYVVRVYADPNCNGNSQRINVWDNTCRSNNVIQHKSFRVEHYGGNLQVATFRDGNTCSLGTQRRWRADGKSGEGFRTGNCLNLAFTGRALGSQSG